LNELQRKTGLAKATLRRILRTLQAQGFAWQGIGDGRYRASYALRAMSDALAPHDRLAELAGPILDDLCDIVLWPSDLAVRNRYWMQVMETTRPRASVTLNRVEIGYRSNMLLSSTGRAYLAFCPDEERDEILALLRATEDPGHYLAHSPAQIARIIGETRDLGYGRRDPSWGGHYSLSRAQYSDQLTAIAVPVMAGGSVLGCINLGWFARLFSQEEMARRHLGDLKHAANAIAAACEADARRLSERQDPLQDPV
jgi:IclR family mhp operon transcriptional activator